MKNTSLYQQHLKLSSIPLNADLNLLDHVRKLEKHHAQKEHLHTQRTDINLSETYFNAAQGFKVCNSNNTHPKVISGEGIISSLYRS